MSTVPFTEKAFYLAEFRGRTLALSCTALAGDELDRVSGVLGELEANGTKLVLIHSVPEVATSLQASAVAAGEKASPGEVWRALRSRPRVSLCLPDGAGFGAGSRERVTALGVSKWVILDALGPLTRDDGTRISFADLNELGAWLAAPSARVSARGDLLAQVKAALEAGVPAVNICAADGLGEELFSYAGSGTLFTRERYVSVRKLGIDDFDAAADLVRRGVAEGYLAERSEAELDLVFANGYGAFVEGRHLAGIGALMPHPGGRTSEIASLYTLTRFLGEGVGGHLVTGLLQAARERGCSRVFACTTQERVAIFFERQGFERVMPEAIPPEKWRAYDPERRERLLCLERDFEGPTA